ncbi:ATP-dependent DNA helicase [Frankliniella fusca]|uniref:ATP-dependent DNA helicase n=1 Tax=Frankliniella fusca TaxID=407009 RepID=A0AAE1GQR1_9NEOP|nr:ATP-dependent DNA helicase [Frankliniella fusca]
MVGCNKLAMINRRCKEAKGCDEDFRGLIVLLLGDIKQLPPVRDNSFFSKKSTFTAWQRSICAYTCHRQAQDQKFVSLLDNMSELQVSKSDYAYLSSRFTHNVSTEEKEAFQNALRLFSTKKEVKAYNIGKLAALIDSRTGLSTPVLKIKAKHNCSQAKEETTENAEGLEAEMYPAKGCKVMLKRNLWIDKKLCNGTIGTVHDILFAPESDTPSVILCHFPSYNGPSLTPGSNIVPIKPILKSWTNDNGVNCTRYQFPITLCYACSIHKSQGMTLDKAIINIGEQDFSLGLSYVAFSRVRSLNDLLIEPFCVKRLEPSHSVLATLEMRKDFLENI